jgi:hypothetical protein
MSMLSREQGWRTATFGRSGPSVRQAATKRRRIFFARLIFFFWGPLVVRPHGFIEGDEMHSFRDNGTDGWGLAARLLGSVRFFFLDEHR